MPGARRRSPGSAVRLIALALVVAACGATIPPIVTSIPSQTPGPATAAPSEGRFVPAAYPTDGAAPCGETDAPDASHAPYAGNLKRIRAKNATTVVFELCSPDAAFLSKIASPAFGINDTGWLEGHIGRNATGPQAIVGAVNGTGPYRLERWQPGIEISLARNGAYRGDPAANERLIFRRAADSASRLAELQDGVVDGIDDVDPAGAAAVADDVTLRLAPRPGMNVLYLGFNNTFAPFDNQKVRQAIAIGIDRQRLVDTWFPAGSEVPSHYAPCVVPHGCDGDPWYAYDPPLAKEMLTAAGYPDGFDTTIAYRAEPRPYLPDPTGLAGALKTQLFDNLGIRAELVVEPEDSFVTDAEAGRLDGIHLLGQGSSDLDVSGYLGPRFGSGASAEFGTTFTDIGKALATGTVTADGAKREAAYVKANNAIRTHVPMVPLAHTGSVTAYRADVNDAVASAVGQERFARMAPGDRRQFVWLTSTEVPGLYCADETEVIALTVCSQLVESLYAYDPPGATPVPSLAERCEPNGEATVWTCTLRKGVLFHDGSRLDANDVVLSYAVQWDAEHPLHGGRDGTFAQFVRSFEGFLNAPRRSP